MHAPAGLDAGCDRPEAIALSILAEIQAVTNSRAGGKLKHRREPIHPAVHEVGSSPAGEENAGARPSWCEITVGTHV